jgi:hypothetical protein
MKKQKLGKKGQIEDQATMPPLAGHDPAPAPSSAGATLNHDSSCLL